MQPIEEKLRYVFLCWLCSLNKGADWGPVRWCTCSCYQRIGSHREHDDFGIDGNFLRKVQAYGQTHYGSTKYKTSMRRFEKLGIKELLRQNNHYLLSKLGKPIKGSYETVR